MKVKLWKVLFPKRPTPVKMCYKYGESLLPLGFKHTFIITTFRESFISYNAVLHILLPDFLEGTIRLDDEHALYNIMQKQSNLSCMYVHIGG